MQDSVLNKSVKCEVLGFTLAPFCYSSALLSEENRVQKPANEFLLPGRINELSHNSEEENLKPKKVERRNGFYNNSSSFENGGILNRGPGPYNHMGDAVTKYLVIPDLAQWGNSRPYQCHIVGRRKEEDGDANSNFLLHC